MAGSYWDVEHEGRFSFAEWRSLCEGGFLIDDDGSGYYGADDKYERSAPAIPSQYREEPPEWAQFVVWFNK